MPPLTVKTVAVLIAELYMLLPETPVNDATVVLIPFKSKFAVPDIIKSDVLANEPPAPICKVPALIVVLPV